jgi:hypothetical protein
MNQTLRIPVVLLLLLLRAPSKSPAVFLHDREAESKKSTDYSDNVRILRFLKTEFLSDFSETPYSHEPGWWGRRPPTF